MPGRTPHEALDQFIAPLQLAVSCVSDDVIQHGCDYQIRTEPYAIQVGTKDGMIQLGGRGRLRLAVQLQYRIIKPRDFKISTAAYSYAIWDKTGENQILRWDWHPRIDHIPFPHLHIQDSKLKDEHLVTSRVTLEQVIKFLITQWDVKAIRRDWKAILARGMRAVEDNCTWRFEPS